MPTCISKVKYVRVHFMGQPGAGKSLLKSQFEAFCKQNGHKTYPFKNLDKTICDHTIMVKPNFPSRKRHGWVLNSNH